MEEMNAVITKLDQLDSFMYVLEGAYPDACTGGGEESARFCNLLYNEECFEQRRLRCERKRANRLVNELQKLGYVVVAPD